MQKSPNAPAEVESPQRFLPRGLAAADGFPIFIGRRPKKKKTKKIPYLH
jgi:hypothetical protein